MASLADKSKSVMRLRICHFYRLICKGDDSLWFVVVHGEASFKVVAIVKSKEEAIKIARNLKDMGRVFTWEAEEL